MTTAHGLWRLFRFELPFTAGICVVLGSLLALGQFPTLTQVALGFLIIFFIAAAPLILNDYFDVESDRINAPHRPLPAGLVKEIHTIRVVIVQVESRPNQIAANHAQVMPFIVEKEQTI